MSLRPGTIERHADRHPDKAALIEGRTTVTYAELQTRARRLAGYLAARFRQGARFGILLPNSIPAALGLLAAPSAGLIAVPIDTDISPWNFERLASSTGIAGLLTSNKMLERLGPRRGPVLLADGKAEGTEGVDLGDIIGDERHEKTSIPDSADDAVACLLHTAGTTGAPKGVKLTRRNLAAAVRQILEVMRIDETILESIPTRLSHSFGFARLRSVLEVGGTAILEDGFLRPDRILNRIKILGANAISSVPAGFSVFLEYMPGPFAAVGAQIRFIEIGSAPMSRRHRDQLLGICPNARICMHYGLTESSRAAFLDLRAEKEMWDTVGRPSPGVSVRIEAESGSEAAPGTAGQILLRGDATAAGYWDLPDLEAQAFSSGWFRTNDLGFLDEEGYLHLTGRASEMVNLGGLKFAPLEVEEALAARDEILEAAVVGIPAEDTIMGGLVRAYLVLREPRRPLDIETLKKDLLEKLEPYKIPAQFNIVPALPKTDSGKVRKDFLLNESSEPKDGHA